MAGDKINISLSELLSVAGRIRSLNGELSTRLQVIKNDMNALESSYQSEASATIRSSFNALSPKFDEYREVIESYSKFLEQTVANYSDTEATLKSSASSFK